MKHSKQTRMTAALFAAAISTAVGGNSAEAAFSPADQQIAAVLYGPPPVMDKAGDLDKNNILDARDVTLMKRELMFSRDDADVMLLRHLTIGQADYSGVKDFNSDRHFSKADVRAMLNRMTDAELPASFTMFVYPVAYDSAAAKELFTADEKQYFVSWATGTVEANSSMGGNRSADAGNTGGFERPTGGGNASGMNGGMSGASNSVAYHMASFDYAYNCIAAMEWLFQQVK